MKTAATWGSTALAIAVFLSSIVAIVVLAGYVSRRVVPPRARQTVRSTQANVTFGIGCWLVALAIGLAGAPSRVFDRPEQLAPWAGLIAFFALVGALLCAMGAWPRVKWDKTGLRQVTLLGRVRVIGWNEITALEPRGLSVTVRTRGRRVRLCDLSAEGLDGLLKAAKQRDIPGVQDVIDHRAE